MRLDGEPQDVTVESLDGDSCTGACDQDELPNNEPCDGLDMLEPCDKL